MRSGAGRGSARPPARARSGSPRAVKYWASGPPGHLGLRLPNLRSRNQRSAHKSWISREVDPYPLHPREIHPDRCARTGATRPTAQIGAIMAPGPGAPRRRRTAHERRSGRHGARAGGRRGTRARSAQGVRCDAGLDRAGRRPPRISVPRGRRRRLGAGPCSSSPWSWGGLIGLATAGRGTAVQLAVDTEWAAVDRRRRRRRHAALGRRDRRRLPDAGGARHLAQPARPRVPRRPAARRRRGAARRRLRPGGLAPARPRR